MRHTKLYAQIGDVRIVGAYIKIDIKPKTYLKFDQNVQKGYNDC